MKLGIRVGHDSNQAVLQRVKNAFMWPVESKLTVWFFDGESDSVLLAKVLCPVPQYVVYSKEFGIFEISSEPDIHTRKYWS